MCAELLCLLVAKLGLSSRRYVRSCHKILILVNTASEVKTLSSLLDIDGLVKYLMELANFLNPKF
jgi:hypothetical protein